MHQPTNCKKIKILKNYTNNYAVFQMTKLKIIYVQLLLSEQSRVRSIDVLWNGTTPNIVNGNGWIHVKVPQPQHYELDDPKA